MRSLPITLTGPTASGKSFLLDTLVERGIVSKVVSYTTREPRAGETHGKDYYFLDDASFRMREDRGEFIENTEYNGYKYGTTFSEIENKINLTSPGCIILEPNGVDAFDHIGSGRGWKIINAFVYVPLKLRTHRIVKRTMADLRETIDEREQTRIVTKNMRRAMMIEHEKIWLALREWDLIVPGDNVEGAISLITDKIQKSNTK